MPSEGLAGLGRGLEAGDWTWNFKVMDGPRSPFYLTDIVVGFQQCPYPHPRSL